MIVLLLAASCGYPSLSPLGDAGAPDCSACQLLALAPSVASTGDTITLEGTFTEPVVVNFSGGVSQAATFLGRHRAAVAVPASAMTGNLTVTTGGVTLGPLPFRHASAAIALHSFVGDAPMMTPRFRPTSVTTGDYLYVLGGDAGGSAERASTTGDSLGGFASSVVLRKAKDRHASVVIGNHVYVLGGEAGNELDSVEVATVDQGTLGPFDVVPGVHLVHARRDFSVAVVGNYLYVFGGYEAMDGELDSVERATIHPDGSLGSFAVVSDVSLASRHDGHTSVVIGRYVYILGGYSNDVLPDVEQATINADDGTLSRFSKVAALQAKRVGHTSVVLGNRLYVIGGLGDSKLGSVEVAAITGDGQLGSFAMAPGAALQTARDGHTSALVGDSLYVMGGNGMGGNLNTVERATILGGSLP